MYYGQWPLLSEGKIRHFRYNTPLILLDFGGKSIKICRYRQNEFIDNGGKYCFLWRYRQNEIVNF